MAKITENHACRAIVIEADCKAKENRVEAWISAHCHVSSVGSKQVCSEQISFLLKGGCTTLLPSIVFSHLDSDLPFYLWWQEEFREPMDPQLWTWVDRVIYDSQGWEDFRAQMRLLESAEEEANQRIVFCDLNWTRLDNVRFALAQFFDHPASHHNFAKINSVRIDFAPGFRSTAVLFAGWLAAQLNWQSEKTNMPNKLSFVSPSGSKIDIELRERPGEPIGEVAVTTRRRGISRHSRQVRRPFGSFTRKTGRKAHAPVNARRKKRSSESDERRTDARRTASRLSACGQSRSRFVVAAVLAADLVSRFSIEKLSGRLSDSTLIERRYRAARTSRARFSQSKRAFAHARNQPGQVFALTTGR